ncbi:MAG: hypothetical protein ACRBDL_01935 [Alphaproteobacteria bacterium]
MKHIRICLFIGILFLPLGTFAQDGAVGNGDVPPVPAEEHDEPLLMIRAVLLSAKADAYAAYCEKETALAKGFIAQFHDKRGLTVAQVQKFETLRADVYGQTIKQLKTDNKPCQDLNVMMARFDVMQKLKDVSYLLNGIDPETLPKNPDIPNLEDLLPPEAL